MREFTSVNKIITPEQFAVLSNAILDGEYSWACVLLLQFAGEEPSSYIPYRTYYRLVKKHTWIERQCKHETTAAKNKLLVERKYSKSDRL